MVNDRQITISVGNNRKSVNWQPQTLMLSEFYEKLRIPSRSTETMQEYLSLRKSEQDDKKDIGRPAPQGRGRDRPRNYHPRL